MAWNHPHTAKRKSGKGPKGKRQRAEARRRAAADREHGQFAEEVKRAPVDTHRPSWR